MYSDLSLMGQVTLWRAVLDCALCDFLEGKTTQKEKDLWLLSEDFEVVVSLACVDQSTVENVFNKFNQSQLRKTNKQ